MKSLQVIFRASLLCSVIVLLSCSQSFSQQPIIDEVDKVKGSLREVVSLKGSGFGTSAAQVQVWFGASKGSILTITNQLLEVEVPAGATYDQIFVNRTDVGLGIGLSAFSQNPFLYSFGGTPGISAANFAAQIDFQGESGLYDLCLCDFNSDGLVDIATANDNANAIAFFQNGSIVGTFTMPKLATPIAARSLHATCGDLTGDGRPELIISEGGEGANLYVLRNNGSYSFSLQTITLTGRKPKRADIADLDRDGKPDLVVTDQKSGNVIILKNQSTLAAVSFAAPQIIAIPGATSTDGLDLVDLDGDQRPEITTSQFLTTNSNLFVLKNTSTIGAISFNAPTTLTIGSTVVNIRIGDLDGDSKPDIAVTQLLANGISVFLNQSTSSQLLFAAPAAIATDDRTWGIDFGDLDGDGMIDICTASIVNKAIAVLNNNSIPGSLNFQRTLLPTTFINRHVKIGDLDNDGKPDIAFTSIDDNNLGIPASKISIIRNRTCLSPKLSPDGPITICSGFPLTLKSTQGGGVTYEWRRDGTVVASGADSFLPITVAGSYTVTALAEGGTCSVQSTPVAVTVSATTAIGTAVASNNGPICFGDALQLTVNDVGATSYTWSGPANYSGTGLTPAQVSNFAIENTGRYDLDVFVGGCLAQQVSTIVEAVAIPQFSLSLTGGTIFCDGTTRTLTISPATAGFTYKWFEATLGEIGGQTLSSYTASSSGSYFARITSTLNPGCAPVQTQTISLTEVLNPVAAFDIPIQACLGQQVSFVNQSVVDAQTPAIYTWSFGDATTSADENPQHTYATIGNKSVKLSVTYANGICLNELTKSINITTAPLISIINTENRLAICNEEDLVLEVSGGSFQSYSWSNGQNTSSITIDTPGPVSVEVQTTTGCILTTSVTIGSFGAPTITVQVEPEEISLGTSAQLTASGLENYEWTPIETLSDPFIPNPLASPLVTTIYTVTGRDVNGCLGEGTAEVRIKGESIVNLLSPANSFSPNGDSQNEFWVIGNIQTFDQCTVSIFDNKGVKVFEAKPYRDTWDGTLNGKQLPQGVYYYIIRCDGQEGTPRNGSITLLR